MRLIADPAGLARLAGELSRQTGIAVDLEGDSLHHYRESVCLMQISYADEDVILDTVALRDLTPLKPVFADPAIRKIFHSADYDLRSLYRDFTIEVAGLFDTQIAAQLLGEERIGLADMLAKHFEVTLDKRLQRADWSRRPLTPDMTAYAVEDTKHLDRLAGLLEAHLAAKGRLSWAVEEFLWMEKVRPSGPSVEPLHLRVKGASRLKGRELAVLEELLRWREAEAERRDVPPFKVIHDGTLLAVAQASATRAPDLLSITELHRGSRERYGAALLVAVSRGRAVPAERLPSWPRGKRHPFDPLFDVRLRHLKSWRTAEAERLGLQPGVLINNALLEEISRTPPATAADFERFPGMRFWQRQALGAGILGALAAAAPPAG